jgi:glyceraldehyde 3-phosphate dehydrogenase
MGVNSDSVNYSQEQIFSNASCTTNCAAPLFKVLSKHFGIESALLTTVHAYTATQSLLDEAGKTFDRSRAAGLNIIPSTTGAAKAVAKVIPELNGKLDAMSLRVPVPTGSFTDITAQLLNEVSVEQINQVFSEEADKGDFKDVMSYETEVLVSSDIVGSKYSALFDSNYTIVINNKLVKICAWYDNEWGYSNRLVDLIGHVLR